MKSGELCAGYGGLAMAIETVFGSETAWFSEFEPAPSKILAYHWPDVPNYGDMTKIDWSAIELVDVLGGGTPCQDVSTAGRRRGMTEGTRSNLFIKMCDAIEVQQPEWVVWENVRGAYSATADSDLEQCPGCLGDTGDGRVFLRALGRVLGNLHDLGYDTEWRGLRAADVGACQSRFRVFVLGHRRAIADSDGSGRFEHRRPVTIRQEHTTVEHPRSHVAHDGKTRDSRTGRFAPLAADTSSLRRGKGRITTPGQETSGKPSTFSGGRRGTRPVGDATLRTGHEFTDTSGRGESKRQVGGPDQSATNATDYDSNRGSGSGTENRRQREPTRAEIFQGDYWGMDGDTTTGTGKQPNVATTPAGEPVREKPGKQSDLGRTNPQQSNGSSDPDGERPHTNWGPYQPAIRSWEKVIGRPASRPTEPSGRDGGERLSPRFTEWMMGLPAGWVTDPAIGISRNDQLKACGNGVVPQQAIAALTDMLAAFNTTETGARN